MVFGTRAIAIMYITCKLEMQFILKDSKRVYLNYSGTFHGLTAIRVQCHLTYAG